MALSLEQKFNCLGCSANDKNVYVDDILQSFITFLNSATCIPWIRSHENIDRPDIDETGEKKGQYGLIEILQSERVKTKNPVLSADETVFDNSQGNLDCYEIHSERTLTIRLAVYRENGEANRNQHTVTSVQPVGAGIDVLERLIDVYEVRRIRQALLDQSITIMEFSPIEWNKEVVNHTWENIGEMQITAQICATSSIADANIKCIILEICGHEPKELCEPFEEC